VDLLSQGTLVRNRYRLVRRLGQGGGGTVYLVDDLLRGGAKVALKALFADAADGDGASGGGGHRQSSRLVEGLRREFRVLAQLSHPALARVHDFGWLPPAESLPGSEGRSGYFMTRDFVDGDDLATALTGHPWTEVVRVAADVCSAMEVLHRAGLIHGDFKPANAILDGAGDLHLIDFGLSRRIDERADPSGTLSYVAPEIIRGQPADGRSDLYALGITLYQLCTGQLPVDGSTHAILGWHLEGPPASPRQVRPDLPAGLDAVARRLTDRNPDRRYPSAAETCAALLGLLQEAGAERGAAGRARPAGHPARSQVPAASGAGSARAVAALDELFRRRVLELGRGNSPAAALAVVVSESGSGDDALLQTLRWRAQLLGVEALHGAFRPGDQRGFGAIDDILLQVDGLLGPGHELVQKRSEALGVGLGALGRLEPGDRYRAFEAIGRFLGAAGRVRPLLVTIAGADGADATGRALLRYLAHSAAADEPVFYVVAQGRVGETSRTDEDPLWGFPRVELAPLTETEVHEYLTRVAGRRDPELSARVVALTGGNPSFVTEVARRLEEAGWPAAADLAKVSLPQQLAEALLGNMDRLSPDARSALERLAVESEGLPEAALGVPPGVVLELLSGQLVLRAPDGRLALAQGGLAQVAYAAMAPGRRQQLHTEAAARAAKDGAVERLARHALRAGDLTTAIDQAVAAVERLVTRQAHHAALSLGEEILAGALPDRPHPSPAEAGGGGGADPLAEREALEVTFVPLRLRLGEIAHLVGDYPRARRHLDGALAAAVDADQVLEAQVGLGRVLAALGEDTRAIANLRGALATGERGALPMRLQAYRELGRALFRRGDYAGAAEVLRAGMREAPAGKEGELEALLGLCQGYQADDASAAAASPETLSRALAKLAALADGRGQMYALNYAAIVAYRRGEHAQALMRYQQALERARQLQDVERIAALELNVGTVQYFLGDYTAYLGHLSESVRLFSAMGATMNLVPALFNLAVLRTRLGLFEQARRDALQIHELAARLGVKNQQACAHHITGFVEAHAGVLGRARTELGRAHELYAELGQSREAADVMLDLSDVELEDGRLEAALAALTRADALLGDTPPADLSARRAALRGRLAARRGDPPPELLRRLEEVRGELGRGHAGREIDVELRLAEAELCGRRGDVAGQYAARSHAVSILEGLAGRLSHEHRTSFWLDPRRQKLRQSAASAPTADLPLGDPHDPASAFGNTGLIGDPTPRPQRGASRITYGAVEPIPADSQREIEERFYRLLEINRKINAELDLARLLELIMDTAVELTGAERGFLILADPATAELRVEVCRHLDARALATEEGSYSRSIAEKVLREGAPLITTSATEDPRFESYLSVHKLALQSVLGIPIRARGRTVGVLYMESRITRGKFTLADQRLLLAFGDQVALALTNAQLLAENVARAKALEATNTELVKAKGVLEELAEERARQLERRTKELADVERDLEQTRDRLAPRVGQMGMIGRSAPMRKVFAVLERVVTTDVPVLIQGESGTGKEMVARALHQHGVRKPKPFVAVNCAAIPETLLESELFGHVRGAFTGADRDKSGLFLQAHGGTLFLDEIGDMPKRMQLGLLRALQEKQIRPVGGQKDIDVDVRVVAASNRLLAELAKTGQFREDLFYRLNVVTVHLPSLRERLDDIPLLVDFFMSAISERLKSPRKGITRDAVKKLMSYRWPGNVRQLEHALLNAWVMSEDEIIDVGDLTLEDAVPLAGVAAAPPIAGGAHVSSGGRDGVRPQAGAGAGTSAGPGMGADDDDDDEGELRGPRPVGPPAALDEHRARERQKILETLEATRWNKSKACALLGMPRRTFYRRLREYDIL
jgi:transcriptional regulator with GAF, ATPase, and Fis domain/tetratricopeptide (TPR) repeat protein